MAKIHFILQGKGGVGKSMIASMLYQGLMELGKESGKEVIAYDTDPVNRTLAGFEALDVKEFEIMDGRDIDPGKFDILFEELLNAPQNAHVIVDNGASSFVSLLSYINENEVVPTLIENGHDVLFHTVITGGQAMLDTIAGFQALAGQFDDAKIAVWLNPFFGKIKSEDGRTFDEFSVYKEHEDKCAALIELPEASGLGKKNLEQMFAKKWTFEKGIKDFGMTAERNRIRGYWAGMMQLISNPAISG